MMKRLLFFILSAISLSAFGQNDFKGDTNTFRGVIKTPNIIQRVIDTTNLKVDVVDALGNHYKMYWPAVPTARYKEYTALLTQTGTSAPSVTIIYNDLGTVTWARTSAGSYTATTSSLYTANKSVAFVVSNNTGGGGHSTRFPDTSTLQFYSWNTTSGTGVDEWSATITIKVYIDTP